MILNSRVSWIFVLLDSSGSHWRASSIDDTLLVFLKRLETYLAALRWIISIFCISSFWLGFHTDAQYSRFGRINSSIQLTEIFLKPHAKFWIKWQKHPSMQTVADRHIRLYTFETEVCKQTVARWNTTFHLGPHCLPIFCRYPEWKRLRQYNTEAPNGITREMYRVEALLDWLQSLSFHQCAISYTCS